MFPGFSVCLLCVRTRTVIVSELVRNVHTSVLIGHGWGLLPLRGHIVSVTDKRECWEVPRLFSLACHWFLETGKTDHPTFPFSCPALWSLFRITACLVAISGGLRLSQTDQLSSRLHYGTKWTLRSFVTTFCQTSLRVPMSLSQILVLTSPWP